MLAVLAAVFTLLIAGVVAGEVQHYGETAFKAATSAGKTVLLDFHADWCPVCRKQGPLLESLAQEDKLKNVVVLKVDYDDDLVTQKKLKRLAARYDSLPLVFGTTTKSSMEDWGDFRERMLED